MHACMDDAECMNRRNDVTLSARFYVLNGDLKRYVNGAEMS